MMAVLSTIPPGPVIAHTEARAGPATDQEQATLSVARGSDGMEGSPPHRPADCRPLMLSDVVVAILDRRVSCPEATSAALVRERDGDGVAVHLILLDDAGQPLPAGPGSVIAATFGAQELGPDLRDAFGDRSVVILR
jgi:hypothetical protein